MITHIRNGEVVRVRGSASPGLPSIDHNGITMNLLSGDHEFFKLDGHRGHYLRDRLTGSSRFIVERLL